MFMIQICILFLFVELRTHSESSSVNMFKFDCLALWCNSLNVRILRFLYVTWTVVFKIIVICVKIDLCHIP